MWKLDFVWRSANQVKLPRKFLALDYRYTGIPALQPATLLEAAEKRQNNKQE